MFNDIAHGDGLSRMALTDFGLLKLVGQTLNASNIADYALNVVQGWFRGSGVLELGSLGAPGFFGGISHLAALFRPLGRLASLHIRGRDAAAIQADYDVSNDFYRLWLNDNVSYSGAYFRDGREDIDQAQTQKIDHICAKLRLAPGDRLLDIGCGRGGLLRRAACGA